MGSKTLYIVNIDRCQNALPPEVMPLYFLTSNDWKCLFQHHSCQHSELPTLWYLQPIWEIKVHISMSPIKYEWYRVLLVGFYWINEMAILWSSICKCILCSFLLFFKPQQVASKCLDNLNEMLYLIFRILSH